MRTSDKPELVRQFIRGRSIAECAEFFAIKKDTAERVVREGITQLTVLNAKLAERINSTDPPLITTEIM